MSFERNTAVDKMLAMRGNINVVQGGTWSGKTYGIVPIIANECTIRKAIKATITAETHLAVVDGCAGIFKKIMEGTHRWHDRHWNGSRNEYRFGATNSTLQFKAFDTVGKAKQAGKRDILFINEANHVPYEIADALITRSGETWVDFNPDKRFWVHDEILSNPIYNSDFIVLTYKDNEQCPEHVKQKLDAKMSKAFFNPYIPYDELFKSQNIKDAYHANWCKVYVFGEIGGLEGRIFNNWEVIDNIPKDARLLGYGVDFGYTNDVTAITAIYKWNNKRILDEMLYMTGILPSKLAPYFPTKHIAYCDAASPDSRDEMKARGVNAVSGVKGEVVERIALMQEQEYYITKRSTNIINEFENYIWKVDKMTGRALNVPIDTNNHAIDGIGYHENSTLKSSLKRSIRIKAT